jgi:hypothetical protein
MDAKILTKSNPAKEFNRENLLRFLSVLYTIAVFGYTVDTFKYQWDGFTKVLLVHEIT